jgi:hypothetical protein
MVTETKRNETKRSVAMPRKPIGDHAMTGAERLRLFRERKRQERKASEPAAPSPELTEAREEIERLRAENAALKTARAGAAAPTPPPKDLSAAKRQATEARQSKRTEARAAAPAEDEATLQEEKVRLRSLDLKVIGADRKLAQWLLNHPKYSAPVVAGWLGCSEGRIRQLRKWASDGFVD